MKKLRNFKCNLCHVVSERLVNDSTKTVTCNCSKDSCATRCLSAPRSFGNTTGKSPSTRY